MPGQVADEEGGEPVLREGLTEVVDDLGRGVRNGREMGRFGLAEFLETKAIQR